MNAYDRARWRAYLRGLREECSPVLPVRVRLLKGPGNDMAQCCLAGDRESFVITIYESVRARKSKRTWETHKLHRIEILDALIHEWAHALAWHEGHDDLEHHDALWGVAYSRCYQAVVPGD